ncbi:MAG TPA: hypothetical protein VE824_04255 [Gaiellales bacterium]|nr:hypothetical protein [Gaiellales bacterium]
MNHTVVVTAQIRPGKREELVRMLEEGPPFDLADKGFDRHLAFLGDQQLVLVFEGERAVTNVRSLAASLPLSEVTRMGRLVSNPQVLTEGRVWTASQVVTA